jgi:hypothetical protein
MLKRLKRDFSPADILNTVRLCKAAGITVMLDLLLGSPGETKDSIVRTIELMKQAGAERVGVSLGVRIYPQTELAGRIAQGQLKDGLVGNSDPLEPLFFLEPEISPFVSELLEHLVGNDERFFFFNPQAANRNYNYNANQLLVDAIQKGYRGAYWDILRKIG